MGKLAEVAADRCRGGEDRWAWHGRESIGEVKVDDGMVWVFVVMVFDVFVEGVWAVRGADSKLVWFECFAEVVVAMVDVSFGCEASECCPDAEWSDFVVWLQFGGECGRKDRVKGVVGELAGGDAVDEDG